MIQGLGPTLMWVAHESESSFPMFRVSTSQIRSPLDQLAIYYNGNMVISGSLTQNSDRSMKKDIAPVAPREILAELEALPISTWRYRDDPNVRHLGPMAQDFHAAFGLGSTPTGIDAVDADGVSLAAIQGLAALVRELQARVRTLDAAVESAKSPHSSCRCPSRK